MPSDVEDLMIEIAWRDYDICFTDKTQLEQKASIILATNGVLIGLILSAIDKMNYLLMLVAVVCLFLSAIFSILAISLRNYKYVETMKVWKNFEKDAVTDFPQQAKRNLFATIDAAARFNRDNYENIVIHVNRAIYSFLIGLFLIALALLSNLNWSAIIPKIV